MPATVTENIDEILKDYVRKDDVEDNDSIYVKELCT